MLNQDYYVREKLREFDQCQVPQLSLPARPDSARPPVVSPVVRLAGRALRCLGEGLESWAAGEPERMPFGRNPR